MARIITAGQIRSGFVRWIVGGTVAAAGFFGLHSASAQTTAPSRDPSAVIRDGDQPDSKLVASDQGNPTALPVEFRQSVARSGSLILMELRTQRGQAKPGRLLVPDIDPRLKPLGW